MAEHQLSRRQFLAAGGAGLAALALGMRAQAQTPGLAGARPNIIFVLTDDQGYGELGCHGNPIIKTPNIDRFHAESVRFTDFHVSPTCAPTRSSLMTGRHEFKNGITHTILERERMTLKATTIAQVLKAAGYTTGIFGKWHLGDEDAYQPGRRGFDEVFIHGGGGIGQMYPGSCGDAPGNRYFDPALRHNGTFVKTKGFCTDLFFAQATQWIDEQRKGGKPFFVYLTPNAPHAPYDQVPEEYTKPYQDKGLPQGAIGYYGMITNIDANFGKLVAKVKEWGIENNTLVIFMTDNGHSIGNVYNAGMHGMKGTPYEGGVRVPCFMRWPAALKGGVDVKGLTAHLDIFPTFAELAGAKVPEGIQLDGRSLTPLMKNPAAPWPDRTIVTHAGRWPKGSDAEAAKFKGCSIRDARFRLVNNEELYDIQADPGETKNVIEQYPGEVKKLRAAYDAWWAEVVPLTLENERAAGPKINPFSEAYFKQFGGAPTPEQAALMAGPQVGWDVARDAAGKGKKKKAGAGQGKKKGKRTQQ